MVLAVFFLLPRNQLWMAERIVPYWGELPMQKNDLSEQHRRTSRYGASYTLSKLIADSAAALHLPQPALVLVPPTAYFKKHGIDYHVPEPTVFYYFTGLHTVWPDSKLASSANSIAFIDGRQIRLRQVRDSTSLRDSISTYLKYGVQL